MGPYYDDSLLFALFGFEDAFSLPSKYRLIGSTLSN
jgi:hypothetical protein